MRDIDCVEFRNGRVAALVEHALDNGFQENKYVDHLILCAFKMDVPGFLLLYKLCETMNPTNPKWNDIREFRVRRVQPNPTGFVLLAPFEWAKALVAMHNDPALTYLFG